MTTIHIIYTFLLIIITIYLIVLQYYNYSKYIELRYNILVNINFYLILICLAATCVAILIVTFEQLFITSGKILGQILTDCTKAAEQTNIELTKTHGTPNSTYVDVEVVPEAKSTSSENQTEFKPTNSCFIQTEKNINQVDADGKKNIIVNEANSKANSEAKEISSDANTKDLIPSPTENKKPNSYIERVFSSLPNGTQQYYKKLMIKTAEDIIEKPSSPDTKKVVVGVLTSVLGEESKVSTPLELGIQDPNNKELQVPFFRAEIVQKDGSVQKIDCINFEAAASVADDTYKEHTGKSKLSFFEKTTLNVGLKAMGLDKTVCFPCNKEKLSLPILPNTKAIVNYDTPPSPSGSPHNLF